MKFSQIQDAKTLHNFLEKHAQKHKFLFHFTTAKSLAAICKNRTWRFGCAAKMNDLHEFKGKTPSTNLWNTIYSTCFSFGDEDNIAMWAMYGIPWEDAVRIRVETKDIINWVKDIKVWEITPPRYSCEHIAEGLSGKRINVSFHDICYYQGYIDSRQVLTDCPYPERWEHQCTERCNGCPPKVLRWWDQKNHHTKECIDVCTDGSLVGFVKNSAWAHENETRLMLQIEGLSEPEYVDLPVPISLLKNVQVSIGPRSTLTIEQVEEMMEQNLPISEVGNWTPKVSESYFHQEDYLKQLRRHCNLCSQKTVIFKNSLEDSDKMEEK